MLKLKRAIQGWKMWMVRIAPGKWCHSQHLRQAASWGGPQRKIDKDFDSTNFNTKKGTQFSIHGFVCFKIWTEICGLQKLETINQILCFLLSKLVNSNLLMTLLVFTGEALQGSYHVAFAQSQEPENLRSAVLGLVRNARGPMALKSLELRDKR